MIHVLLTPGLPWQHNDAITFFYLPLKGVCTSLSCLGYGKVCRNSMRAFWKGFETKFNGHKNSE